MLPSYLVQLNLWTRRTARDSVPTGCWHHYIRTRWLAGFLISRGNCRKRLAWLAGCVFRPIMYVSGTLLARVRQETFSFFAFSLMCYFSHIPKTLILCYLCVRARLPWYIPCRDGNSVERGGKKTLCVETRERRKLHALINPTRYLPCTVL